MPTKKELETIENKRSTVPVEVPTVESPRKEGTNLEVESWMEKIEKRFARIPKGQSGVQDDTVVVQHQDVGKSGQPPVQLPVNQQQLSDGKRAPVESGIAWLVGWAMRRIKMLTRLGRRVRLEDIPEAKIK